MWDMHRCVRYMLLRPEMTGQAPRHLFAPGTVLKLYGGQGLQGGEPSPATLYVPGVHRAAATCPLNTSQRGPQAGWPGSG